jgi:hypothetical protein
VGAALVLFVVLGVALGGRLLVGSMDRDRIADYVTGRGGRVVSITWAPFGRGWFGEKNDRIYEVVYYDAEGRQHFATAKTSLWSGVYWTEDAVTHEKPSWYEKVPPTNEAGKPVVAEIKAARGVGGGPPEDPFGELELLRRENQRLRDELAAKGPPAGDAPSGPRDYEPRRPR